MSTRRFVVPGWAATHSGAAVALAATDRPEWVVGLAAAFPAAWGTTVILLILVTVFAEGKQRRNDAYRTLKLVTGR